MWSADDSSGGGLSLESLQKILFQLGSITWQLSQLRFDKIGSLFEDESGFQVRESLSRGFVMHERDSLDCFSRGPFYTDFDYYSSLISAFIELSRSLPLDPHCFVAPLPSRLNYETNSQYLKACDMWNDFVIVGSKIDSSENRLDYIIIGNTLAKALEQHKELLLRPLNAQMPFALHHADLSVNNIFVDRDCNITCIIDWAFCSSVPLSVLLTPPGLPQSRNELEPSLITAFEQGFKLAMGIDNKLTTLFENNPLGLYTSQESRIMWCLLRLLNFDSTGDYPLFQSLWESIHKSELNLSSLLQPERNSPRYLSEFSNLEIEDEQEVQIHKKERDYFRDDIVGFTLARKLTFVSQWTKLHHFRTLKSPSYDIRRNGKVFLADDKLWKWILACLEDAGMT